MTGFIIAAAVFITAPAPFSIIGLTRSANGITPCGPTGVPNSATIAISRVGHKALPFLLPVIDNVLSIHGYLFVVLGGDDLVPDHTLPIWSIAVYGC